MGKKPYRPLLLMVANLLAAGGFACSLCFSHALGASLQGIGAQTLPKGKTIVGIEGLFFSKSNAAEDPGVREREHHWEYDLHLYHGLNNQWLVNLAIPYVHNRIIRTDDSADESSAGLGDMTVGTVYQLKPTLQATVLTAFSLSVKLPTGANSEREENGDLKEQHLQLGTGSTDVTGGVSFTWQGPHHLGLWYGGLSGRVNGSNSRGFRYGSAIFYSLGYSHPLSSGAVGLELNGKVVAKDRREDGSDDENSGGHVLFAALNVRWPVTKEIGLILSYQHPVLRSLNGDQTEHGIFSLSASRMF